MLVTDLPEPSTNETVPAIGGSQHSFAPSDAMLRCRPAQLVARTAT